MYNMETDKQYGKMRSSEYTKGTRTDECLISLPFFVDVPEIGIAWFGRTPRQATSDEAEDFQPSASPAKSSFSTTICYLDLPDFCASPTNIIPTRATSGLG